MTLTALERLDLNDQLDDLMVKAASAKGLDLLDINDQIDDIMTKLGYGVAAEPSPVPPPAPVPEPEPEPQPEPAPASNALVADYLADKFIDQPVSDFISTLQDLNAFVGSLISMEQVKEHAANWLAKSGLAA